MLLAAQLVLRQLNFSSYLQKSQTFFRCFISCHTCSTLSNYWITASDVLMNWYVGEQSRRCSSFGAEVNPPVSSLCQRDGCLTCVVQFVTAVELVRPSRKASRLRACGSQVPELLQGRGASNKTFFLVWPILREQQQTSVVPAAGRAAGCVSLVCRAACQGVTCWAFGISVLHRWPRRSCHCSGLSQSACCVNWSSLCAACDDSRSIANWICSLCLLFTLPTWTVDFCWQTRLKLSRDLWGSKP